MIGIVTSIQLIGYEKKIVNYNLQDNYSFIEQNLVSSSRFTNVEEKDPVKYQDYLDNYTLNYTHQELIDLNYSLISQNEDLMLYFHPTSFSILIHNKKNNYQWSSRAEFIGEGEANRSKLNEMQSGIWVEYVLSNNITRKTLVSNVLSEKAKVSYQIISGQLGFIAKVNFDSLGFSFDVEVKIVNNQLHVFIDHQKIQENLPRYRLIGIQLFPYLGAARQDKLPGYLMIPDGAGALIRFNEKNNILYQARFYGDDYGYSKTSVNRQALSAPVFGIVHDVDVNGVFGIIESGDTMARLFASLWGYESVNYFRLSPRFYYREVFTNIINKTGAGNETVTEEIKPIDIKLFYTFLRDDQASYVGMANTYKSYLENKQILTKQSQNINDIPIALDFIMSELEPSFIGTKSIKMTSPNDVLKIYHELNEAGINKQVINLLGWSVSGIYDTAPYTVKYSASSKDYHDLLRDAQNNNIDIYFNTNYVTSSKHAERINYGGDVARQISKLKMELSFSNYFEEFDSTYYLYPESSLKFAKSDFSRYQKLGINKLSFSHLGNTLFSYYENNNRYNRLDSLDYYHQILDLYGKSAIYQPNSYMYKYTSEYFHMPLYNSGHHYFTDVVPFIPIVLKGNINYYSSYLNYNAIGKDQLLNLIDFGVNPSFLLTNEATTKMRYTKANRHYSTYYRDYYDKIIASYDYINGALSNVNGAYIEKREILSPGVVRVSYSNQKTILINYTSNPYTYLHVEINPKDYVVV